MNEDRNSEDFIRMLGKATMTVWGDLPQEIQQQLFEKTVDTAGHQGDEAFRETLATYLHNHHPRTAGSTL